MVYSVVIKDNQNSPIHYLSDLKTFKNGTEYIFKPGVNIIVGENGCGKTTLMNLIKKYLLVDYTDCSIGLYGSNINGLYENPMEQKPLYDGVDVYADYQKNTFRLSHAGEKESNQAVETFEDFGTMFTQRTSSTGEGVLVAVNSLFKYMFSKDAPLTFNYKQFKERDPLYYKYITEHRKTDVDEFTILMDEPDRNLDIENIDQIKAILSFHKPQTQVIAVVHNPLLIYNLHNNKEVNVIEMTKGYVKKVKRLVNNLILSKDIRTDYAESKE
jgi:ATPase subunit of ABC transporter with duplicated ATPase domains